MKSMKFEVGKCVNTYIHNKIERESLYILSSRTWTRVRIYIWDELRHTVFDSVWGNINLKSTSL